MDSLEFILTVPQSSSLSVLQLSHSLTPQSNCLILLFYIPILDTQHFGQKQCATLKLNYWFLFLFTLHSTEM
jgi:hypothetical protein